MTRFLIESPIFIYIIIKEIYKQFLYYIVYSTINLNFIYFYLLIFLYLSNLIYNQIQINNIEKKRIKIIK
jgi:hypothetical protein